MKTKNKIWIGLLIIMGLVMVLTTSCNKEEKISIPVLTTTEIFGIISTSATCGGDITNDGGATVTERGVCWSTTQNPTTVDTKTIDGTGAGTFASAIKGLTATTTYYVRAYATNSAGTAFGNEFAFTTSAVAVGAIIFNPDLTYGSVSDIDGNIYKTIQIGTQLWMAENLKTTRYSNGDLIETTIPATLDISGENSSKYQWANGGNEDNVPTYGRLYTWYAVTDSRNVCPTGWHVPSYHVEWITLTTYLGGEEVAGGKLKETGTTHWKTPNNAATNESGFTALPSGIRYSTGYISSVYDGSIGEWWSTMDSSSLGAFSRSVGNEVLNVTRNFGSEADGLSVRCLKD